MKYLKRKIDHINKAWLLYDQISSILICHSLVSAGTSPLLLVTAELLIPRPAKRKYENRPKQNTGGYVLCNIMYIFHMTQFCVDMILGMNKYMRLQTSKSLFSRTYSYFHILITFLGTMRLPGHHI